MLEFHGSYNVRYNQVHIRVANRYGFTTFYISHHHLTSYNNVVGVMKIGNNVPRAGIEATSLAFRASAPTITPCRLPDVTLTPMPTCLCGTLPEKAVQTPTSMAFHALVASVLIITPCRLPRCHTIPMPTGLCSSLPEVSTDHYNTINIVPLI